MVALGQKDFQQVTVLKRMIKDLNFPIKVVVCDTMREKDGLAMSSRNSYLSPIQRRDALLLYKSIQRAVNLVDEGIVDSDQIKEEVLTILKSGKLIQVDYIEIVDKENLDPLNKITPNQSIIVLAVWIEKVRLIDNQII